MKIIAVVVTYNRLELLKHGIECLRRQKRLTEIIVVDNGATDGTHEWLDAQQGLHVIHQENVGGSGGFYTGIDAAYKQGADWIWCMDDDVFPREDCLENLLANIGDAAILSPRRIMDGKVFTHEFCHYDFANPLASMHGKKLRGNETENTEIVGADFEGPFISRRVVEKIGLPNRELFIFCDDTDYCLRAHLAGFKLRYVPTAIMDKHKFFSDDTWTTRNQKKKWKRYYQVRNEAYLNHHYGRNWGVKHLRSFIGVVGYWVPAVLSMPFTKAWQWKDLQTLWQAYKDGINEKLGKR
ncbi:MAG: glycosyltransferase family 2 protein [Prevotella sp.]|jgi:GT2 family glycosyltransferase|nr:glycosyltransferase family 2 protein [Prevotella sp.]